MVMTVKTSVTLKLVLVMLLGFTRPSLQYQRCHRSPHRHYGGCSYSRISSGDGWCIAEEYVDPDFSFYIKPGLNFRGIKIQADHFFGTQEFTLRTHALEDPDKWYQIEFKKEGDFFFDSYHLSVVGKETVTTKLNVKASKFRVMISGSPFYSVNCNPANFREPQKTPNPQIRDHTIRPPPNLLSPPGTLLVPVTPDAVTPMNSRPIGVPTENGLNFPGFLGDTNGYPWWMNLVIVGTALLLILAVIITTILALKKKAQTKNIETADSEEKGLNNLTYNNDDDGSQNNVHYPTPNFYGSNDSADHINEDPIGEEENDYENINFKERHIIPATKDHEGQPFPLVWANRDQVPYDNQPRRGSAHESENSLYGCVINRTA